MHVISQKMIKQACEIHLNASAALKAWLRIMQRSCFNNFAELRQVFKTIDKVGHLYVFNVGANKLRLIAAIYFNRQKIYLRHILVHQEYDLNKWRE